ncbi:MAG: hypothetical protein CL675_13820 [Bdellovibrionaceae bacterium]|nr:hypothetical protein [Pseudobdellovibrionaceae bacterium]
MGQIFLATANLLALLISISASAQSNQDQFYRYFTKRIELTANGQEMALEVHAPASELPAEAGLFAEVDGLLQPFGQSQRISMNRSKGAWVMTMAFRKVPNEGRVYLVTRSSTGTKTYRFTERPWESPREGELESTRPRAIAAKPLPEMKDSDVFRPVDSYYFPAMTARFGGVTLETETNVQRTVQAITTVCPQEPLNYDPLRHKRFVVEYFPAQDDADKVEAALQAPPLSTQSLRTTPQGCLALSIEVSHLWYQCQRYFLLPIRFTDPTTGISETLTLGVNPWDEGWVFARDARDLQPHQLEQVQCRPPQIHLNSYSLDGAGMNYSIDHNLSLVVEKNYYLKLSPRVQRADSITRGRFGGAALRDGFYLLNIGLFYRAEEGEITPKDYVSSWEQIVEVKSSEIVAPLKFDLKDMTLMGARNQILMQLQPIDESKVVLKPATASGNREIDQDATLRAENLVLENTGLHSPVYQGPIIPLSAGQGPILRPSHINLEQSIKLGQLQLAELAGDFQRRYRMTHFDRMFRLKSMLHSEPEARLWLQQTFGKYILAGPLFDFSVSPDINRSYLDKQRLQASLCDGWAGRFLRQQIQLDDQTTAAQRTMQIHYFEQFLRDFRQACIRETLDDRQTFSLSPSMMIRDIDPERTKYIGGTSFNYNINESFSLGRSENWGTSQSTSSSLSFSASLKAEIGVTSLGASRTETLSSSENYGRNLNESNSISYGRGTYLVVQHSQVEFVPTEYQACQVIRPKSEFIMDLLDKEVIERRTERPRSRMVHLWDRIVDFFKVDTDDVSVDTMTYRDVFGRDLSLDLMETGLRLCEDGTRTNDDSVIEDYYYVTQHFTAGDMQDTFDNRNRPWLMMIRSTRDFNVFLSNLQGQSRLEHRGVENIAPVEILADAYDDFAGTLPAWPGIYNPTERTRSDQTRCDNQVSAPDLLVSAIRQVIAGPFVQPDGNHIFSDRDFRRIWHCGEE